jgi:hypothetical protein
MKTVQYDTEVQFNHWDTGWYDPREGKPEPCLINLSPCPQEAEGWMVDIEDVQYSFNFS